MARWLVNLRSPPQAIGSAVFAHPPYMLHCTALFLLKICSFPWGICTLSFLGSPDPPPQTASRSSQQFSTTNVRYQLTDQQMDGPTE